MSVTDVPGFVAVDVLDVAGRRIARLIEGTSDAGAFATSWDGTTSRGREAVPGFYFVRLAHEGRTVAGTKITLRR